MLLRFRFKNFRSFRDEQELSFIASGLKDGQQVFHSESLKEGVLCTSATYGSNASGKSNVIAAFQFMKKAVQHSQRSWQPEAPIEIDSFRLGSESSMPSTFEVDILLGDIRYVYSFTLNTKEIVAETLHVFRNARRQLWFSRGEDGSTSVRTGKGLQGENKTIQNLMRPNSLFLSAAAQNNHVQLTPLYRWFTTAANVLDLGRQERMHRRTMELCRNEGSRAYLTNFLHSADLGIVGFEVAERDEAPSMFQQKIFELIKEHVPDMKEPTSADFPPKIRLVHRLGEAGTGVPFEPEHESAGTLTWLNLSGPVLYALSTGGVLFVDELDSSLHPLLTVELVKLFNSSRTNPNHAQLYFNTHDTNLLESAGLGRDQIWFVEKDPAGASHLYALTDFKPRQTENIERGYLQGRYGAIPFFTGSKLFDQLAEPGTQTNTPNDK